MVSTTRICRRICGGWRTRWNVALWRALRVRWSSAEAWAWRTNRWSWWRWSGSESRAWWWRANRRSWWWWVYVMIMMVMMMMWWWWLLWWITWSWISLNCYIKKHFRIVPNQTWIGFRLYLVFLITFNCLNNKNSLILFKWFKLFGVIFCNKLVFIEFNFLLLNILKMSVNLSKHQ